MAILLVPPPLDPPSHTALLQALFCLAQPVAAAFASTLVCTHKMTPVMDVLPSRVFMNGNSQAVRIPAEFRLATDRVQISRTPEGDLLIHPCPHQRGKALLDLLAGFDADFVAALEQQQEDQLLVQERESL
jgi:antitoxin VapB